MLIKIIICSFLPRENLNCPKKSKIEKAQKNEYPHFVVNHH